MISLASSREEASSALPVSEGLALLPAQRSPQDLFRVSLVSFPADQSNLGMSKQLAGQSLASKLSASETPTPPWFRQQEQQCTVKLAWAVGCDGLNQFGSQSAVHLLQEVMHAVLPGG